MCVTISSAKPHSIARDETSSKNSDYIADCSWADNEGVHENRVGLVMVADAHASEKVGNGGCEATTNTTATNPLAATVRQEKDAVRNAANWTKPAAIAKPNKPAA